MDIESVYTQYFKDIFLYLRSLSADAGTAEEITQETFMKAALNARRPTAVVNKPEKTPIFDWVRKIFRKKGR